MSVFDANQIEKQILWSVWLSYGYEEKLLWAVTCEKAKSYLVETSINYTSYLYLSWNKYERALYSTHFEKQLSVFRVNTN